MRGDTEDIDLPVVPLEPYSGSTPFSYLLFTLPSELSLPTPIFQTRSIPFLPMAPLP